MADVKMPQLGETVADGTVAKWFKQVGDPVTKGEALFEVSTDKVDTEIPAQATGVLQAILVSEGTTVDVGTVLAIIDDGTASSTTTASASGSSVASATPTSSVTPPLRTHAAADAKLSPVVRRLLDEHGLHADDVPATGPNGRLTRDDVLAYVAARESTPAPAAPLSPVVRRLIEEHGLDPASITATGADGRLTRRDVEAHLAAATRSPRSSGDEVIPFTKIRALTAEHMIRSKATSAHTLMVREIDYEVIEQVRRRFGASFKEREGFSLTYLPFNAVAATEALREFPHLNASVGTNELIVHHDINLGIAVDLDNEGLVVPVVKGADRLDTVAMARTIRGLATGAKSKKLTVDDMSGGTFTITNPGPFGTLMTGAVINQPQVAILSTDGVTRKPVVVTGPDGSEAIAIHSVGLLALTFDHRAVDGAYAARFLARVANILTTRDWSLDFTSLTA